MLGCNAQDKGLKSDSESACTNSMLYAFIWLKTKLRVKRGREGGREGKTREEGSYFDV